MDRHLEITQADRHTNPAPQSRRVLIVEDDNDARMTLAALLGDQGHEVSGVATAKAVWNALDTFEPDVLVIDINLPDGSGFEVARDVIKARGVQRAPLLIAVTAWNKHSDAVLAKLAGFDYHVGKPYEFDTLLKLINSPVPERGR